MYTTLISVAQLQSLLEGGQAVRIFDCSSDLAHPELADELFGKERIAGAVQAHLDRHLSAKPPAPAVNGGRHPLPPREQVAHWLGTQGLANGMQAVVYDRNGGHYCGRLWWMLKWLGHEAVAVLDGGLQAWKASGGALDNGPAVAPAPCRFETAPPLAQAARHRRSGRPSAGPCADPDRRPCPCALSGRGRTTGPGCWTHPRCLEPAFLRKFHARRIFQTRRAVAAGIRVFAGSAPGAHRGAPLRQRRHRLAQRTGHGNRRTGPDRPVRGQLERMVQHARPALRQRSFWRGAVSGSASVAVAAQGQRAGHDHGGNPQRQPEHLGHGFTG